MMNQVCLMGRLTRDPELRTTSNGKSVSSFSLAVERDYDRSTADFFDVTAWGQTAEFISKYFSKGRMMVICGKLQTRDWQDKNGNRRKTTEVVAEHVYFADSRKAEDKSEDKEDFVEEPAEDGELPF